MREEKKQAVVLEVAMGSMSLREEEVFTAEFRSLDGAAFPDRFGLAMRAVELHRSALKRPWDDLPEDRAKVFRAVCAEARKLYGVDSGQLTSKGHEAKQARRWIRTAMSVVFGTMETARILGTDKGMVSMSKRQLLAETPEMFASAEVFGEELRNGLGLPPPPTRNPRARARSSALAGV